MRGWLATIIAVTLWASSAFAETNGRFRLQLGEEYDTNVKRWYSPLEDDFLTRMVVDFWFRYLLPKHRFHFKYLGGLKLFNDHDTENLLANKFAGSYGYQAQEDWHIGLNGVMHDTTLQLHTRDYRLISGQGYSRLRLNSWVDWEAFIGVRHVFFKPDRENSGTIKFSHYGPLAGTRLHLRVTSGVVASVLYQAELRLFDYKARQNLQGTLAEWDRSRLDIRHTSGASCKYSVRYWGSRRLYFELGYLLSVNDSNSYGSSAFWHRLRAVVSAQLPLRLSLHLMGTLQLTEYIDGLYLEGDWYEPEADENENSLVARLSLALTDELSLVLQAAIYRNDFNSQEFDVPEFQRETLMLALAYELPF